MSCAYLIFCLAHFLSIQNSISESALVSVTRWDRELLERTGLACPGRDSCWPARGATEPPDWAEGNCACDEDCDTAGDCCIDALEFR